MIIHFDHQAEVRRQIEESERYADAMRKRTPSLLKQKLEAMKRSEDSIPIWTETSIR